MKKSKLDTPHIRQEVMKRLAVGENKAAIARDLGLHRSDVSRFAKREDILPLIQHEQMKLVEAVPDAVENVKEPQRSSIKNVRKDPAHPGRDSFLGVTAIGNSCGRPGLSIYDSGTDLS